MGATPSSRCCECTLSTERGVPIIIESFRGAATSLRNDCEYLLSTRASTAASHLIASPGCAARRSLAPEGAGCLAPDEKQRLKAVTDVDFQEKLQAFTESLIAGLEMRLLVDGVGELPITASLDRKLSTLALEFNQVRKDVFLRHVRQVGALKAEYMPGSQTKKEKDVCDSYDFEHRCFSCCDVESSRFHGRGSKSVWIAQLKLHDDRFCCFSFGGNEQGLLEADEFCDCVRALVEIARFEQAKLDLEELAKQGAQQGLFLSKAADKHDGYVASDSPANEPVAGPPPNGGGVLEDELSRSYLVSRLLAAGAVMDEGEPG